MPAFKKLIFNNKVKEIIIFVVNLELFESIFSEFRDINFTYKEYEEKTREKPNYKYPDKEQAFYPKIYECAATLLLRPDLYLCDENESSKIFKKLREGECELDESNELLLLVKYGAIIKTKKGYKCMFK